MVKEIAEELIPIVGLDPANSKSFTHTGNIQLVRKELGSKDGLMPDLKGATKRAVLDFVRDNNLVATVNGNGWVVFQFPPPGTEITENMTVFVELK